MTSEEFAGMHRITCDEYKRLCSSMRTDEVITCLELLKAKRHRSPFRQAMEARIREWLEQADSSIRTRPLTPKEFEAAKPKWPITYTLPSGGAQ